MHTFQHVQANAAEAVDVGVVDFGQEADFGRGHGVVVWQEELEFEDAACGRGLAAIASLRDLNTPS